jgi:hypothetical protein
MSSIDLTTQKWVLMYLVVVVPFSIGCLLARMCSRLCWLRNCFALIDCITGKPEEGEQPPNARLREIEALLEADALGEVDALGRIHVGGTQVQPDMAAWEAALENRT